ncbi:Cof-type HAD-IIB family hydrolase [Streptococcus fryi]
MTQKIIAIDLDGTLLRSDHTISEYSVNVLKAIQKQGHQIVIATGRPYRMAIEYYRQLELTGPMINFNGSLTHIPGQKWAFEHNVRIERDILFNVLKNRSTFELDFVASEYRKNVYLAYDNRATIDPKLFGLDEITDDMTLHINKVTKDPNALLTQTRAADKYQLADDIKAFLNHAVEVDSWGGPQNILEFSPKGVHKAYALEHLLKTMNKTRQDLIAFGDEHNDTEMLGFASIGYAMKNANPLLLNYAKEQITYTNNEDGVAKTLEKLFL